MNKMLIYLLLSITLLGCTSKRQLFRTIIEPVNAKELISEPQREVDAILMLLAYSLVFQDWQEDSIPRFERRGYNIGAIIVNQDNEVVEYGLNSINSTDNSTQHGELRAITKYLSAREDKYNLTDHTIYATLEPCIMCAGMITMTSTKRVVFGQDDVEYSKAFERLAIDTRPIGGFAPYPRVVTASLSELPYAQALNEAYAKFLAEEEEKYLARFLVSQEAKKIFKAAYNEFLNLTITYEENQAIYAGAKAFLKKIENNGEG